MKRVIYLIMLLMLITGCGKELNEVDNTNKSNNTSNKTNVSDSSNKKLVCTSKRVDDEEIKNNIFTFIFDKDGKKLKLLSDENTRDFKNGSLSDYNVKQYESYCKDINDNHNGLSCDYTTKDNARISSIVIRIDYEKLDSKSRELIEPEGYLDVENYDYEKVKEFIENIEYTKFICE